MNKKQEDETLEDEYCALLLQRALMNPPPGSPELLDFTNRFYALWYRLSPEAQRRMHRFWSELRERLRITC